MSNAKAINLDKLALTISGLSRKQREELELAFSPDEEKEILARKQDIKRLTKDGNLLTLD